MKTTETGKMPNSNDHSPPAGPNGRLRDDESIPKAPWARAVGRTRFIVLLAVASVLFVAMALFLLGSYLAFLRVWEVTHAVFQGEVGATSLTVEFLEIVSVMLKAVVFYIIGVGLYSLFIGPLNVTYALGVETLNDLESKAISVIVVILAVTFLERFIVWQNPFETLQFGITLAVVIAALVLFQFQSHRVKEARHRSEMDVQTRAQEDMFHRDREVHEVREERTQQEANPPARG